MIIKSILDTDLYKLTMQNAVTKLYPYAQVEYSFINRGGTKFPEHFAEQLRWEIREMEKLKMTTAEKEFLLKKCYYLDPSYVDFLNGYQFDSTEVGVIQEKGDLKISVKGPWYRTILWEVPLMAIVSELYFKMTNQEPHEKSSRLQNNSMKATAFRMNGAHFAEFGTRRRFSYEIQNELVGQFAGSSLIKENFVGTSNVHLAHVYNLTPIGTHAHEWFSFHAAKFGYKMANKMAMDAWAYVYRGDLGIALPDTFTTDVFFSQFERKFAKLYDGVRHDSGDPIEFADKTMAHYNRLGIDPKSKTIVFSDGLDVKTALGIKDYCRGKIRCSFGIGTNLTNDVGVKPLNMVIKMTLAKPEGEDWIPTIKLSDTPGKHTGDPGEIDICKHVLRIRA